MTFFQTFLIFLIMLFLSFARTAGAAWEDKFFNPKPLSNDFTLPLPCNGSIVFRKITTPVEDEPLADRPIRLGWANEESGYLDYLHRDYILGPLSDQNTGERFYYLGKYEVTQDQYQAVMLDNCPTPSMRGLLPAGNVSWFDAIEFSRRLSEWLLTTRPDALPMEADQRAYLRLPTEAEWEYAARGGAAVSEVAFRERFFPMDGELREYAWYQGAESSRGKPRPIGRLKSNPLGIFDLMGNVEELVLDPFYMNRLGRRHGQPGGFVTKGGSFRQPAMELRTAYRSEFPYFSPTNGSATRFNSFGLRLVVTAHVNVSLSRTNEIKKAWIDLAYADTSTTDDPIGLLDDVIDEETESKQRSELETVKELVLSERTARAEIAARALKIGLFNGAVLIRMLKEDHSRITNLEAARKIATGGVERALAIEDEAALSFQRNSLSEIEKRLVRANDRFTLTARGYTNTLFQLSEDFPDDDHQAQHEVLKSELEQSGQAGMITYVLALMDELSAYRSNPSLEGHELIRRITQ